MNSSMATPDVRPTGQNRSKRQTRGPGSKGSLTRDFIVGDTGFEPVTSSVSMISGPPDNAATSVVGVPRCTAMIAGYRID